MTETAIPSWRIGKSFFRFVLWTLAMLMGRTAVAVTPLDTVSYAPDATVFLGGATVAPRNVARDDLAGVVTLVNIGAIANGTDVVAYDRLANRDPLLAFDTTLSLPGGITVRPGDVVRFDGSTYSLELDAAANGIPNGVITDALGEISPNDLLLSFDVTIALDGILVAPEDLVRIKDGSVSLFFDGSLAGVPVGQNLDAVHCLQRNGHLLLSFDGSGTVGGVGFDDEDILEYDPGSNTWSFVYDGSLQHAAWPPADLAALSATASTPPNPVVPSISGTETDGAGGAPSPPPGAERVFGTGTPRGKAGNSCIEIYLVGANGVPDAPPGSVDDVLLGVGGTDAAGHFVDGAGMLGIPLSGPLRVGDVIFPFDVCEGLIGVTATIILPAPALSATGIGLAIALLLIVALSATRKATCSE